MQKPDTKLLLIILSLALLASGIYGYWHWRMIGGELPHSYREASQVTTTQLLLEGAHPYSADQLPLNLQVYGIVYNAAVAPFAWIFGNALFIHRLVTGLALIGVAWIAASFSPRQKTYSLLVALWTYLMLVPNYTILARPDALGLLLSMAALWLAHRRRFDLAGLALALPLGLLAFMAKPYFGLTVPVIASYVFFYESKSRGLVYSASFFAALAALYFSVEKTLPYYWQTTIGIHGTFGSHTWAWLGKQLIQYAAFNAAWIALACGGLILWLKSKPSLRLNLLPIGKPLLGNRPDFATYNLIIWALAACWLARNQGAFLIYIQQLVSPWLAIYAASVLHRANGLWFRCGGWVVAANILILIALLPPLPQDAREINRMLKEVSQHSGSVVVPPPLAHLSTEPNIHIFDNGQTEYMYHLRSDSSLDDATEELLEAHTLNAQHSLGEKQFVMVIVEPDITFQNTLTDGMDANYRYLQELAMPLYFANWVDRSTWGRGLTALDVYVRKP